MKKKRRNHIRRVKKIKERVILQPEEVHTKRYAEGT